MTLEPEPGHAGGGTGRSHAARFPSPAYALRDEERSMTIQSKSTTRPSSVTTGAIVGSRKVYSSPEGRDDILVPFREIALDPSAKEAPYRAYDCSGAYTDPSVTIDLEAGLPPIRREWIAKRGFDRITPRAVRPEDNGDVGADKLVPACPADFPVYGGKAGPTGHPVRVRPRRHHHRGDDLRRPPREHGPRLDDPGRARARRGRRKLRRGNPRLHHAGVRARRNRPRPRHHPGEHQPSRSWSRSSSAATSW